MLGWVFQLSPCAVPVTFAPPVVPLWQLAQLRASCGKVTAEKSAVPILYGVPAITLGSAAPALL